MGRQKVDLTAQKIGNLTPLNKIHGSWECLCDCGNIIIKSHASLMARRSTNCGCLFLRLEKEKWIGKKITNFTVISFHSVKPNYGNLWNCLCDCGKVTTVSTHDLKSKKRKSCKYCKHKVVNNFARPEVQEKCRINLLQRHGVTNLSYMPEVIEKRRQKYRQKYGKLIKELAQEVGKAGSTLGQQIKSYGLNIALNIEKKQSSIEKLIESILPNGIPYITNIKSGQYRPDFLIANKLVVNCDGLYWHSDKVQKNNRYHIECMEYYKSKQYTTLFFREDEILTNLEIVKSIIYNRLNLSSKIYARKCQIKKVTKKEASEFLRKNHLMGNGQGDCYGLYYNDILYSIIQIINKKTTIEISRFCHTINHLVIGGLGKLINYIKNIIPNKNIISFVDKRYGTGESLKKLGFISSACRISFKWTKDIKSYHRMKFPGNTGYAHNFAKIWDCGQEKFILTVNGMNEL